MASESRGRSTSPKRLQNKQSKSPNPKSGDAHKPERAGSSHRDSDRSISRSRSASRSRSRSMSVSGSESGSGSRSPAPRRKRARSYSPSRSRSRSSYISTSSRSASRSSSDGPGSAGGGPRAIEVSRLTKNVTDQHIHEIFGVYGLIKEVDLPIVRRLGTHRGTAIVTYESPKAAQKAISHMDRGQLDGSLISVRVRRPPSPPRGPAALRRGGTDYRGGPADNRYNGRGSHPARRYHSPPRRSFGGRSRSPPRRNFGDDRAPTHRSRSPPRRRRSPSRSPSRSPRRSTKRPSPHYGGRRSPPARGSRRNRSYSPSSTSSRTRSSRTRSPSPRK